MANPTGEEMVEEIRKAKPNPKKQILTLLRTVKRPGIEKLIAYLETSDFFVSPASMRLHGCYHGGLADHCLAVYNKIVYLSNEFQLIAKPDTSMGKKPLPVTSESLVIAPICHDFCKINKYVSKDGGGYKLNKGNLIEHAKLSIQRASEFIELTPIEELMIKYHMGVHYAIEMDPKKGEYHLLSQTPEASKEDRYGKSMRNAFYHNPIVEFFGIADMLATQAAKTSGQQ